MTTQPPIKPSLWRSPTVLVTIFALLIFLVPGLCHLLEVDWSKVAEGELWRLITGHLTHYDSGHLFWDLSMFAGLGLCCERRSVPQTAACIAGSMGLISVLLPWISPEIGSYRGLSGVDSGLFVLLLMQLAVDGMTRREWMWIALPSLGLAAFLGKISYEHLTGATLFVDSAAAGFVPLPAAHLLGAAIGLVAGCMPWFLPGDSSSQGDVPRLWQTDAPSDQRPRQPEIR